MKKAIARLVVLTLAVATLGTTASVQAQSNGLGITPRKDYTIKAGEKIQDRLFVSNLSQKEDLRVSIRVVDFKAQNETGTPSLELNKNAQPTPWSLRPFVKVGKSVTVPAGKSTYVPFAVEVPAKQGAGSYYSAIEYVAENATTKQKVNISASSATLMFVTVPGQAREQLAFKQFGTFVPSSDGQTGEFKNFFSGTRPQVLAYRLENKGNVAEQPQGSIIIKNIFGQKVQTINKANPKNQLALINQTRRFETCIKQTQQSASSQANTKSSCEQSKLLPGRYTAQLALFYGLNGNQTQEIAASATFWYLPWWSIVVLVGIILLLVILLWLIIRTIRRKRSKAAGADPTVHTPEQPQQQTPVVPIVPDDSSSEEESSDKQPPAPQAPTPPATPPQS